MAQQEADRQEAQKNNKEPVTPFQSTNYGDVRFTKKSDGNLSISPSKGGRPFSVNNQGLTAKGSDMKGTIAAIFGLASPPEGGQAGGEQQPQQPQLSPEDAAIQADEQEKVRRKEKTDSGLNSFLETLFEDPAAKCRSNMNLGKVYDFSRNVTSKQLKKQPDLNNATQSERNAAAKVIQSNLSDFSDEYYDKLAKGNKDACKAKKALEKVIAKMEKQLPPVFQGKLTRVFLRDENQTKINITSKNPDSIGYLIENLGDTSFNPNNLQSLLSGECSKEDPCSTEQSVSQTNREAARENFGRAVEIFNMSDPSEEDIEELKTLVKVTDDKRVIIMGVSPAENIVFKERGGAFYDSLFHVQDKFGIKLDVVPIKRSATEQGSAKNGAVGTLAERWQRIQVILSDLGNAKTPEEKEAYEKLLEDEKKDLIDLCDTLEEIDRRIDKYKNTSNAVMEEDASKMQQLVNQHISCEKSIRAAMVLTSRIEVAWEGREPDYVFQVGSVVGKGKRADTLLVYDNLQDAQNSAKLAQLDPKKLQKKKLGELLDANPEYKKKLKKAGLLGPGKKHDPDKEVYVVPEGLKTSSGDNNAINAGSSAFASIQEDVKDYKKSKWFQNTSDALGIPRGKETDAAALAAQKLLGELDKIDDAVDNIKETVTVKGKKESTGIITTDEILSELGLQNVGGLKLRQDETYILAKKLRDQFAKDPKSAKGKAEKQRAIEDIKKSLAASIKRKKLAESANKIIKSGKVDQRRGLAVVLSMVASVDEDQPIHSMDLKDKQHHYIVDHNNLAVAPFRDLAAAKMGKDYDYEVTTAAGSVAIGAKCKKTGSKTTVRVSGTSSLTGTTSVPKSVFTNPCSGQLAARKLSPGIENSSVLYNSGSILQEKKLLAKFFKMQRNLLTNYLKN